MYVTPTRMADAAQSSGQSSASSSAGSTSDMQSEFLTLLTTELKTQDPTAPEDPTQMITQLAQFNSLNELISMNTFLGTLVSDATPTSTTQTGAS